SIFFILILATSQAVFYTAGRRILLLYIPLAISYFYFFRKSSLSPTPQQSVGKLLLLSLPLVIFFFSWSFLSLVNFGDSSFYMPSGLATQENDFFIYAQRAQFLAVSGQENYFSVLNTLDPAYQGNSPYHYLELWISSCLSSIFQVKQVFALGLLVKTFFYLSAGLGILAIWERRETTWNYKPIFWVLVLIFLSGVYAKSPLISLPEFNLSLLSYRFKMIVYYPFILGFAWHALRKERALAACMLGALMIATVVVIPAFLGAGGICLTIALMRKKGKVLFTPCLILFILSLGIFLFYSISPSPDFIASMGLEEKEFLGSLRLKNIPELLLNFLGYILAPIPIFLTSILLIFFQLKSKEEQEVKDEIYLFIGAVIFAGAGAYALLKDFENAIQLYYNPLIACLNVGAILAAIIFLQRKKVPRLLYWLLFLSISNQLYLLGPKLFKHHSSRAYHPAYVERIKSLADSGELSQLGGVLKASEDYTSAFSKITYAYSGAYYLQYFEGERICLSLSDHLVPIDPKNARNNLVNRNGGLFYRFLQKEKERKTFVSFDQTQAEFIKAFHINFLVLSKNVTLGPELHLLIKEIIVDEYSGERFILLKNN
ncbi:MAG: hypothetical protein AAF696_14300, partial [Bacteroidota bacterium]